MSFIYSQALVEEFLQGKCSDTEPSALSSGNHTHKLSLWHDKTMEPFRLSRFGMTCKPLMERAGEALLTSWLEDFHAKTSALPEKGQESTESEVGCGNTWRGWLAKFDPDTSLWKTAQCSFIEDSTECLETLPRSGMTRNGLLWELPMLERLTRETGFGFWPTPVASDTSSRTKPYAQGGTPLSLAVKLWPTPSTIGINGGSNSRAAALKRGATTAEMNGGALNPNWVEWLMGWPIGHTDLKPSETAKFHSVQPQPSDFSLEVCE